jgi:hypothetical protein
MRSCVASACARRDGAGFGMVHRGGCSALRRSVAVDPRGPVGRIVTHMPRWLAALAIGLASAIAGGCDDEQCTEQAGLELYERRIAPILADDRPSSCTQCHLPGVDLGLFVQASPCETMACMVDRGVVDPEQPEASLVIQWIDRAQPQGGITAAVVEEERDAMLEWIGATSTCGSRMCPTLPEGVDPCGTPPGAGECDIPVPIEEQRPVQDEGDCTDLTLERVWQEKVYAWRGRCFPCHFDDQDDSLMAPNWIVTGACEPAALATYRTAAASGYLDPDDPMQSLLLLKPLDESIGGVEHGGGGKFHFLDDPAYLDFVYFLTRWAECRP